MKRKKSGFTLVELIVTLSVLGILLAVSLVGILSWRDWADFKKENEYAQTIFQAAENQLTYYSSNGGSEELTEIMEQAVANGEAGVLAMNLDDMSIVAEDSSVVSSGTVWDHSDESVLYSVSAVKADYELYKQNPEALPSAKRAIYDMLGSYLYDKSILDAALTVEFDPAEGLVYAVLYSDKNRVSGFEYNHANTAETGLVNIANRTENYRRDRMVGYYGVDTLSTKTNISASKPVITDLMLNNEETLNLTWNVEKKEAAPLLSYEVILYSKEEQEPLAQIELEPVAVTGDALTEVTADVTVYTYPESGSGNPSTEDIKAKFPVSVTADGRVELVLDAVDLVTAGYDPKEEETKALLENSFSILRFGIEEQVIYCSVQGSSPKYQTTDLKLSNEESALFADDTVTTENKQINDEYKKVSTCTYGIENARHLYNMRFLEREDDEVTVVKDYELRSDFAWSGEDSLLSSGSVYDTQAVVTEEDTVFPQIAKLGLYSTLESETGAGHYVISGLTLAYNEDNYVLEGQSGAGLFMMNYGIIQNVDLDEISVDGTGSMVQDGNTYTADATGSFCAYSSGKLAHLSVLGGTVTGTDYTGGIFGKMVQPTVAVPQSGGFFDWLFGWLGDLLTNIVNQFWPDGVDRNGNKVYLMVSYEELVNRAEVSGYSNVGGITGELKVIVRSYKKKYNGTFDYGELETLSEIRKAYNNAGDNNTKYYVTAVELKKCENYGVVYGSGEKIGGLVGSDVNLTFDVLKTKAEDMVCMTFEDCISAPVCEDINRVEEIFGSKVGEGGFVYESRYVGGFVGVHSIGLFKNCTTTDPDDPERKGWVIGGNYTAGLIGALDTSVDGEEAPAADVSWYDVEAGIKNTNNVYGITYIGGIISCNDRTLENCSNTGTIRGSYAEGAKDADVIYAGGITGFNEKDGVIDGTVTEDAEVFSDTPRGTAVVGGITGKNEGTVTNCVVGKEANLTTTISGGSDTARFTYLGGITGWNEGEITDCDNGVYSEGTVLVTGNTGHIGGLIGYEGTQAKAYGTADEEGRHLSTGKAWKVLAEYYQNDCGTGGIIGYSISVNSLEYVNNYAEVVNANSKANANNNSSVGGIIGRIENVEGFNFEIRNCNNYGDVTSAYMSNGTQYITNIAAGIAATVKYQPASFVNCNNYGTITGNIAGGILARTYLVNMGSSLVQINSCTNFGKITGGNNYAAGIFSYRGDSTGTVVVTDCINTGLIDSAADRKAAGIVGASSSVFMYRCRNYGLGADYGLAAGTVSKIADSFSFDQNESKIAASTPSNGWDKWADFYVVRTENSTEETEELPENTDAKALYSVKNSDGTYSLRQTTEPKRILIESMQTDPMGENGAYYTDLTDKLEANWNYKTEPLWNLTYRYKVIKEIESGIQAYYAEKYAELNPAEIAVTKLEYSYIGNAYQLAWSIKNVNLQPYYYLTTYEIYNDKKYSSLYTSGTVASLNRASLIPLEEDWEGKYIRFSVCSVYYDAAGEEQTTTPATIEGGQIKEPLPTPDVEFELTSVNAEGNACFAASLKNASDYTGNKKQCLIKIADTSFDISDKTLNESGYLGMVSLGDTAGNVVPSVYAEPTSSDSIYGSSVKMAEQICVISASKLGNTKKLTATYKGFTNDTDDVLSYNISLQESESIDGSVYAETVYYDTALGMEVAYGSSKVSTSLTQRTVTASIPREYLEADYLDSLPEEAKKPYFRAYLWSTKGDVRYGHTVASGLEMSDSNEAKTVLSKVTDPYLEDQSVWEDDKLKDGYILEKNTDGTYTLRYSILAVYAKEQTGNYYTTMEYENYVQPAPVLSESNPQETTQSGKDGYLFAWDEDLNNNNARYTVSLADTAVPETVLYSKTGVASRNVFLAKTVFTTERPEITSVTMKVKRGSITSGGYITKLAYESVKEYDMTALLSDPDEGAAVMSLNEEQESEIPLLEMPEITADTETVTYPVEETAEDALTVEVVQYSFSLQADLETEDVVYILDRIEEDNQDAAEAAEADPETAAETEDVETLRVGTAGTLLVHKNTVNGEIEFYYLVPEGEEQPERLLTEKTETEPSLYVGEYEEDGQNPHTEYGTLIGTAAFDETGMSLTTLPYTVLYQELDAKGKLTGYEVTLASQLKIVQTEEGLTFTLILPDTDTIKLTEDGIQTEEFYQTKNVTVQMKTLDESIYLDSWENDLNLDSLKALIEEAKLKASGNGEPDTVIGELGQETKNAEELAEENTEETKTKAKQETKQEAETESEKSVTRETVIKKDSTEDKIREAVEETTETE